MNKNKIGNYLKGLRKQKKRKDGKSFSQDDLAKEISLIKNTEISVNAIKEWELGKSMPSTENLEILAKIYKKSIDEILDGEDDLNFDYTQKYFLANSNWMDRFDRNDNLYQIRNEQIILITIRFKELLLTRIKRYLTSNEEKEFKFLFDNFYILSDYAKEFATLKTDDSFLIFKDAINKLLAMATNKPTKYMYWEIQKFFSEKEIIWFSFWRDVYDLKEVDIIKERFAILEDWQKDMLLAMFQSIEPYDNDPTRFGSLYYKRYEDSHGEYNHENDIKNQIRVLIENGAYLNGFFFSVKKICYEEKRIIDRLEELYNLCLKPIKIYYLQDGVNYRAFQIENNPKNRFLNDYYYALRMSIKGYYTEGMYDDINELYNWFNKADEISDSMWMEIAKNHKVDINKEKKYWMSDAKTSSLIENYFNDFKEKEKKIQDGIVEINILKDKLFSGSKYYKEKKIEIIGGTDEKSIREIIEYWKTKLDYYDFKNGRDEKLTKDLLKNIDKYSIKEIKEIYFKMEEVKDE